MKSKFLIPILSTCLSSAVFAIDPGSASGGMSGGMSQDNSPASAEFDRLDNNKDGTLSKTELSSEPALQEDWSALDRDSDGKVDRSEFSAFEALDNPGTGMSPPSSPATGTGSGGSSKY